MQDKIENRFGSKMTQVKSMLKLDFKRMFTTPLMWIMVAVAFVMPILIFVMTSAMPSTMVDPTTGVETKMETFTNTWQIIATVSNAEASSESAMSLVSMCNLNLLYFMIAVFVCIFVAEDFRSGYAKTLFTVRASKSDYVISKTIVSFVCGAFMVVAFVIGAMLGGAIAGLPFDTMGAGVDGIIFCILTKVFLMLLFVSVFLIGSVFAKSKLWLSLILSLGIGMLFFMIVGIVAPLNSTALNLILGAVGGAIFSIGLGLISNLILKKTTLV